MKRKTIDILFWTAIGVLLLCFVVKTVVDGVRYANAVGESAPFYVYLLCNALYFLLPALLLFVVGYGIRAYKRNRK